jgi:hypothetical protein
MSVLGPICETDHSPLPVNEGKNSWFYIPTAPYVFMPYCLIKQGEMFTSTVLLRVKGITVDFLLGTLPQGKDYYYTERELGKILQGKCKINAGFIDCLRVSTKLPIRKQTGMTMKGRSQQLEGRVPSICGESRHAQPVAFCCPYCGHFGAGIAQSVQQLGCTPDDLEMGV